MSIYINVGRQLDCGCCGLPFSTWVGYRDQDQDAGYGICKSCQGWVDEIDYDRLDQVVAELDKKWPEGSRNYEIWSSYSVDERRNFVLHQINIGSITYDYKAEEA